MQTTSRRKFLYQVACGGTCLGLGQFFTPWASASVDLTDGKHIFINKEALYYEKLENMDIRCKLCPKECEIGDKERGWCGVRENQEGIYYTLVYGNPCAYNLDPIEKKPFFHYLPGTTALSIATAGCNLNCKYCQNWQISQRRPEQTRNTYLPPGDLVAAAREMQSPSIAFTYSEPTVFYEYMLDTSREARKTDTGAVMISAGYMQTEPLEELCEYLTAVKIDLKSFRDDFYREICSAKLDPVLQTLKTLKRLGMWFEIVLLVVPTLNDDEAEFRELCRWILGELGPDVPLHFSRFYPTYQLKNLPSTPIRTLEMAYEIAQDAGIRYAYIGNINPDHKANQTYCHHCGKMIIQRRGYFIRRYDIQGGKCRYCRTPIPGVWKLARNPNISLHALQTGE